MSDSHKFSLLDLQSLDLSKYAKQKLDLNQGATRNPDSTYRRQLSESLARKQSGNSVDQKPEVDTRTRDLNSKRTPAEKTSPEPQAPTPSQKSTESADSLQRDDSKNDATEGQNQTDVVSSDVEKTDVSSEPVSDSDTSQAENGSDSINPLAAEVQQPVKQKESVYSLFNDSAVSDSSQQSLQEVTATDGEIQPPASFQFSENQTLVKLPTEVTETNPEGAYPIPEGLAALLKNQSEAVSSTESTSIETPSELVPADQQQNQAAEALTAQATGDSVEESVSPLQSLGLPEIKITEELKQAIEEFKAKNSDDANGETADSEVDIQAIIQQRYLNSDNENQSDSSTDENNQGAPSAENTTVEEVSRTVIEQLQQPVEATPDTKTEVVDEKADAKTESVEGATDDVTFNPAHPLLKTASDSANPLLTETAKATPQGHETTASQQTDQSSLQAINGNQATPVTNEVAPAAPAGPVIDVKQVDQLVERISTAVKQSHSTGQQLKIRLSPPELGTLQIEVSLKNGEYTAKLEVQNRHAQKVINDNIAQLKEALTKTGVSLDRIDVHINTDASEDQRSSHSGTQSNSGNDFNSQQFSESQQDSEQRSGDQSFVDEAVKQDEPAEQDRPQVVRSQGIVTENVEEIDVQI
ncbi:flagellar hook-length control protein FliK [Gimesia sp.]|uniref:flagellar hook-length control protein FliK n=1 Tax=Gimesia sp. TaxID=2024833 RepID=UPI003A938A74